MKQINDAATAADGIHHIGFETRWDHFLNEDGNAKTLTLTGTAMNGAGKSVDNKPANLLSGLAGRDALSSCSSTALAAGDFVMGSCPGGRASPCRPVAHRNAKRARNGEGPAFDFGTPGGQFGKATKRALPAKEAPLFCCLVALPQAQASASAARSSSRSDGISPGSAFGS